VKTSLREVLADSNIAAIAIAMLLVWSLDWTVRGFWSQLGGPIEFIVRMLMMRFIPSFSDVVYLSDRVDLFVTISDFFCALIGVAAAWILSRWVFGAGPIKCLGPSHANSSKGSHD
jgi:hypothetical protein